MIQSPEDRTLELACTVGSIDNALEAIEEGADVNFQGGAPLFLAIVNRNRAIINMLLDHGAIPDAFLPRKKMRLIKGRDTLVEELIASAPSNPRDIKPDQIEEIDQAIRDEGVSYLLSNVDWDRATLFRDSLDAIGAGQTHRCVAEFLQWARAEHGLEREGLNEFIQGHAPTVDEYRDRYLSSGEDLVTLAKDYLNA
ncbi:MAG: hypothetical protein P1V20_21135 [Verrucomicrobiales bacterium]|nr:hypothetical protein [Verrucomicrobiales bacterium]